MKNIAIFVSGEGEATVRIVKLFNEGNRLHTVLVVANDSAKEVEEQLKGADTDLLIIPDDQWNERAMQVAHVLKDKDVKLLVLDNFELVVPDEIMEAVEGEVLRVSSPEMAPREVVNALEADLRKPVEEPKTEETAEDATTELTPESEWAETLKIQFRPPKVPQTPPELPTPGADNRVNSSRPRREFDNSQPMPSTYLIWSILVTIFCCFVPGIIAIIFSSMVSTKYYTGDIEGARRASRYAEIWIIVSVVLGVVAATLYLPFMFLG